MKTRMSVLVLVILLLSCITNIHAQVPERLNYQAVVRGSDSSPIVNTTVSFRFTIFSPTKAPPEYTETQTPVTNDHGMVSLVIGEADPVSFSHIDWATEEYSLRVECDPEGGTNYTIIDTRTLSSVPYALHAKTADRVLGDSIWKKSSDNIYFNDGNVGVGTINPLYPVHIVSPAISGPETIFRTSVADDPNSFLEIGNGTISDGKFMPAIISQNGTDHRQSLYMIAKTTEALDDEAAYPLISFNARRDDNTSIINRPLFQWSNLASPKMTMLANGYLGIGTTAPRGDLHISDTLTTTSSSIVYLETKNAKFRAMAYEKTPSAWIQAGSEWVAGSALDINFSGMSGSPHHMVIKADGKVGIGTTNPTSKLTVFNNALGELLDDRVNWFRLEGKSGGNSDNLYLFHRRHLDGSNWNSSEIKIQKQVDSSPMHYISFMGLPGNSSRLEFGYSTIPYMSIDRYGKVGIGTTNPTSKLEIDPGAAWSDEEPLFEVKNNDGIPVFAVYNNGVRITIEDDPQAKGPKGGFAIGGFDPTKAGETYEFMRISPDSIRFNINNAPDSKGPKGGFAIGSFDRTKGMLNKNFMHLSPEGSSTGNSNVQVGFQAGENANGYHNTYLGYQAGYSQIGSGAAANIFIGEAAGYNNRGGYTLIYVTDPWPHYAVTAYGGNNICIGYNSGRSIYGISGTQGSNNVFLGNYTAPEQTTAVKNTYVGNYAGFNNITGSNNTYIGYEAGYSCTGSNNVFIGYNAGGGESVSNQLFIGNERHSPLIWGNFATSDVTIVADTWINGDLSYVSTSGQSSDVNLKKDLVVLTNVISKLDKIYGYSFDWNNNAIEKYNVNETRQIGVIAQEVEKVFPQLVSENRDGYKTVAYSHLTPILIQAIKEQQQIIEDQSLRIESTEGEIDELRNQIALLQQAVEAIME